MRHLEDDNFSPIENHVENIPSNTFPPNGEEDKLDIPI